MAVLTLFGQKKLHVVTKLCFRRFLAYFFQYVDIVWLSFVIRLMFMVHLAKGIKISANKFLTRFGPFLSKKLPFWPKINVFNNISKFCFKILFIMNIQA